MLKPRRVWWAVRLRQGQPPSGGCVLKQTSALSKREKAKQPPSGGCVLKQ
ncbi:hypothetical protein l13_00010 [Neisseria weaveri ATCC 51223]|nr:hypothetical protein l13_00010 [Neisseria weaveri ATCC 51223]